MISAPVRWKKRSSRSRPAAPLRPSITNVASIRVAAETRRLASSSIRRLSAAMAGLVEQDRHDRRGVEHHQRGTPYSS